MVKHQSTVFELDSGRVLKRCAMEAADWVTIAGPRALSGLEKIRVWTSDWPAGARMGKGYSPSKLPD
jgi:hypothetical protein